jgi:hypothetical protein
MVVVVLLVIAMGVWACRMGAGGDEDDERSVIGTELTETSYDLLHRDTVD